MIDRQHQYAVTRLDELQSPLETVRYFAGYIRNGRQLSDAFRHANNEMVELGEEIQLVETGQVEGSDGVVGEAIDVIACMLDLIFLKEPDIDDEKINTILLTKCEKWARRYKDSIDGDRTID